MISWALSNPTIVNAKIEKVSSSSAPEIVSRLLVSAFVPAVAAVEPLPVLLELLGTARSCGSFSLFKVHWQGRSSVLAWFIAVNLVLHLLSVDSLGNGFEFGRARDIETALDLPFALLLSRRAVCASESILRSDLGYEARVAWYFAHVASVFLGLTLLHLLNGCLLARFIDLSADIACVAGHALAWSWSGVHYYTYLLNYL